MHKNYLDHTYIKWSDPGNFLICNFRCKKYVKKGTWDCAVEVSAALRQVTISAENMWVTIFIVIMQMGVPVAIMQVVFSAVDYAHDSFYCNSFVIAM